MNNPMTAYELGAAADGTDPAKLAALIDKFDTAMLVTVSLEGQLRARPMAVAGHDKEKNFLYFITDKQAAKVDEINAEPIGLVTMQDAGVFLSLSGQAMLAPATAADLEEMWKTKWDVWFENEAPPHGAALLRFRVSQAEYWDRSGMNRWRVLWQTRKAALSKQRLDDQALPGHAKLDLDG